MQGATDGTDALAVDETSTIEYRAPLAVPNEIGAGSLSHK